MLSPASLKQSDKRWPASLSNRDEIDFLSLKRSQWSLKDTPINHQLVPLLYFLRADICLSGSYCNVHWDYMLNFFIYCCTVAAEVTEEPVCFRLKQKLNFKSVSWREDASFSQIIDHQDILNILPNLLIMFRADSELNFNTLHRWLEVLCHCSRTSNAVLFGAEPVLNFRQELLAGSCWLPSLPSAPVITPLKHSESRWQHWPCCIGTLSFFGSRSLF